MEVRRGGEKVFGGKERRNGYYGERERRRARQEARLREEHARRRAMALLERERVQEERRSMRRAVRRHRAKMYAEETSVFMLHVGMAFGAFLLFATAWQYAHAVTHLLIIVAGTVFLVSLIILGGFFL